MKRWLGMVIIAAGCGAAGADDGTIDWRTDLNKARAEARKTGKPMFVLFR